MIVRVGSTNPVKVEAVRAVFADYYPGCEVVGVEVESGVAEQPMSEEETREGAEQRARNSIGNADYGVGLEGGVCEIEGVMHECAWCVIVKQGGPPSYITTTGKGGGFYFELPPQVADKIRAGGELGPVMNELLNREDVKKQEGAVGVFTRNRVTRTGGYKQLVYLAMCKFVSSEWWE